MWHDHAMTRAWLAVIVVVGCGHSQQAAAPASAAAPPPPPTQCAQVADHLVSEMSAAAVASDVEIAPYRQLITRRCNEDKWSVELQHCLLASATLKDNKPCESLFTAEQNANLEQDGQQTEKAATESSAPGAPPSPPATRAPAPKPRKAGDPCEGGQ